MFHTLVILMIVLTFSAPFVILAQQNTTQPEVPKDATQDVNVIKRQAIADAKQDAKNDHNITGSMCLGMSIPILSLTTGLLAGCAFGEDASGGWYGYGAGRTVNPYAFASVAVITTCFSSWTIYNYKLDPPTHRLIGQPLEYIDAYTDAYKKEKQILRIKYSTLGIGSLFVHGVLK